MRGWHLFRRIGAGCLASVCVCASVLAADLLDEIAAKVERHPVVRAEFVQSKQMAALKRPLVTSGRLVFSRNDGVLWQIEKPYRMSYVLGESRIVEIDAAGGRRSREGRDIPGLAQVGRVFRAMFGANAATLREYFEIAARGSPERWSIELKPRQAQVAQFLASLTISGGGFVEEIRIVEAGGDATLIRFSQSQGALALNDAEGQLFAGGGGGASRQ